jgi:hypothetical protein
LIIVPSQSAKAAKELLPMSISAITTSAPVTMSTPAATASDTPAAKTPDPSNGSDAGDATEAQPPVVAALPPGQGTRIDQIV